MFAEQMMRVVAGVLVGLWVARYLGPAQFGLFSYSVAFAALFSSIAKLGLDSILVRDLVREPALRDVYMGTAFWLKLAGAIVMLAVIAIALQITNSDNTTKLFIFIIASGAIFQSFEVVDFYFQSKVLSKFVSICKFNQLIISSLIKLYLIYIGSEIFWFVIVGLIDQITLAATMYFVYQYQNISKFYLPFNQNVAKKLLSESWPLILSSMAIMIYMRIDQVMIKEMLNEKEVGLYSAATRISEVWYFFPTLIASSIFPSIVNSKSLGDKFYNFRIQRLYGFMFWSAVAVALPVSFFSETLIVLLYGEEYGGAASVLMIHIWAGVFVFIGVASNNWFICEGLQKYATFNTFVGGLVNVILNFLLIPLYGINGAAVATVISYFVAAYLMNVFFNSTRENFYRLSKSFMSLK